MHITMDVLDVSALEGDLAVRARHTGDEWRGEEVPTAQQRGSLR